MTNPSRARRAVAVLTVAALSGLTAWTGLAIAHTDTTAFEVKLVDQHAVAVDDPIHINMRRGTEVTTTRLTVYPGGHTAWHYHPGPHVVAVTAGNVTVFETDCTPRGHFAKGDGFYDPGTDKPRRVHTLYNPGDSPAELVITDFREPGEKLTVAVVDQPEDCF
ncbi:MAG: cupin domain-containing protein [Actinomycetota bacterium]|nr:cupin domain-containing protein [Actinomycetota bacterium]